MATSWPGPFSSLRSAIFATVSICILFFFWNLHLISDKLACEQLASRDAENAQKKQQELEVLRSQQEMRDIDETRLQREFALEKVSFELFNCYLN